MVGLVHVASPSVRPQPVERPQEELPEPLVKSKVDIRDPVLLQALEPVHHVPPAG